jgi:hypothetical protein
MCIQHHVVKCPNHIGHRDQTIEGHTSAPREGLLGHDQSFERYQVSRWMVIVHHADKISPTQPSIITIQDVKFREAIFFKNLNHKHTSHASQYKISILLKK